MLDSFFVSSSRFFLHDPAPTDIYTLSLHDALPISLEVAGVDGDLDQAAERALDVRAELLLAGAIQDLAEARARAEDRKSTRLNSSHLVISYAVFCLKKKNRRAPVMSTDRRIGNRFV